MKQIFFPSMILRLLHRIARSTIEMSWPSAIGITLAHALSVAGGYALIGETALIESWVQFVYFYIVTGSSVGYGDFSPTTDIGKLFSALWVIPGAISLFAFLVGKIIGAITIKMRKTMNGYGNFSTKTGHIVVLGHVPGQTERLLEETARLHGAHDMVIVSTDDLSGQQNGWDYIRATTLMNEACLKRAGIENAAYVAILGATDDETVNACLAVNAINPVGHCAAYFREASYARLVGKTCGDRIETVTSTSVEQLARALSDPGSGEVLRRLVNIDVGATLNSIPLTGAKSISVADLMVKMMLNHKATLIGYRPCKSSSPILSLTADTVIEEGQTVYYVSEARLDNAVQIAA